RRRRTGGSVGARHGVPDRRTWTPPWCEGHGMPCPYDDCRRYQTKAHSVHSSSRWSVFDARIEVRIEDVDEEVDHDEGEGDGEDGALDHRVVAALDGIQGEATDTGPGEDEFDDDDPSEHEGELQTEDGDGRDHRVFQGVEGNDATLVDAFGAGGADVVLVEDLQHRGAEEAGEDGGVDDADGEGGQDQVQEPLPGV